MKTRAIILLFLALVVASCGGQRFDFTNKHWYLGGPSYRVYDVVEIAESSEIPLVVYFNDTYEIPPLDTLFQWAEDCTGTRGNYAPVRVFSTSRISIKDEAGEWIHFGFTGVYARNTPWVYFTTGRSARATTRTIVHEYLHYLTSPMEHPEADDLVRVCNLYVSNKYDEEA